MSHPWSVRLGRKVEHDARSFGFPAPADASVRSVKWRRYGRCLDQGQLGSCTGNASAQALNHKPLHHLGEHCLTERDAVAIYSLGTQLDSFPGAYPPDDTGSSGLAVAKACVQQGRITSYTHAFGLDHILSALQVAPLIVGTDWTEDMFNPDPNGQVHPTGAVAGGHEYVIDGVDVEERMLRFLNSWSSGWGVIGHFFMSFDDFSSLLGQQGDAIQFAR